MNRTKNLPTIGIIMAVKNSSDTVRVALESVVDQRYPALELVVVDGESADGTIEIVEEYGNVVSVLVSEPDSSVYDALNKGVSLTSAEVVGFLHGNDWLAPNAIWTIANAYRLSPSDLIFGDVAYHNESGSERIYKSNVRYLHRGMSLAHPACYLRRELLLEEEFDTRLRISADYEHMLRLFCKREITTFHVDTVVYHMTVGGMSAAHPVVATWENLRAQLRHAVYRGIPYSVFTILKLLTWRLIGR